MNIKTKTITLLAVALALMFALTPIPFASLFLVPVLFIGLTHKWHLGAITGLMFGLVSLMYAFVMPGTIVAIAFQRAPWIAIVPRIFVGLFTSLSFKGFRALLNKVKPKGKVGQNAVKILPYNLAATVGTLTNTILVVGLFYLMAFFNPTFPTGYDGNFDIAFLIMIAIMASIEIVVANAIAAPVSFSVAKAMRIGEFVPRLKAVDVVPQQEMAEQEVVVTSEESEPLANEANEK